MAVLALLNARIEIATIDMSTHITKVELDVEGADLSTTNFGNSGWESMIVGLAKGTLKLSFNNDFAVNSVDDRLWGWFRTQQPFKIRPTNAAISTTNPSFEGIVAVSSLTPVSGMVGDLATHDVTWSTSGPVTRVTA